MSEPVKSRARGLLFAGLGLAGLLLFAAGLLSAPYLRPWFAQSWFAELWRGAPTDSPFTLEPLPITALPGWQAEDFAEFLSAFTRSCALLSRLPDDRPMGPHAEFGTVAAWRPACAAASSLADATPGRAAIAQFLTSEFAAFALRPTDPQDGLFTGYYEPELAGSLIRRPGFTVPLHAPPDDLVMVDLGAFRPALRGQRIAGRVASGRLQPYQDRAAIARGEGVDAARVLVWLADPVDAFFLHIQGSGRIRLHEGGVMRVGYAADNGHVYAAIGRRLIEIGAVPRAEMSMQAIRAWLENNPDRQAEIFAYNPAYIFFRELPRGDDRSAGPLGAQGVPLTPRRSLAVDRGIYPLGVPVWIDSFAPTGADGKSEPFQGLLVTQDTGSALKGSVRGDVFWGSGDDAGAIAGRMAASGRIFILLPRPRAQQPAGTGQTIGAADGK